MTTAPHGYRSAHYWRGAWDQRLRMLALVAVVATAVMTGWLVGVVQGRHQEREAKWRDCSRQYEATAYTRAILRTANPCEGWR